MSDKEFEDQGLIQIVLLLLLGYIGLQKQLFEKYIFQLFKFLNIDGSTRH